MSAFPAEPEYDIGDLVRYLDHHNRLQEGRVLSIEANWWSDRDGRPDRPLISYTVQHPSYRNGRMYVSDGNVVRLIKRRETLT